MKRSTKLREREGELPTPNLVLFVIRGEVGGHVI